MSEETKFKYDEYFMAFNEFKKELEKEENISPSEKEIFKKNFIKSLFRDIKSLTVLSTEIEAQLPEQKSHPAEFQTFAGLVNTTKFTQHPDRVLLAVYHLFKYKNYESITVAEIEEQYKSAYIKKSSNTKMFVNVNIKKGYLMDVDQKDGKSACMITRDGLKYIEEVLKNASN